MISCSSLTPPPPPNPHPSARAPLQVHMISAGVFTLLGPLLNKLAQFVTLLLLAVGALLYMQWTMYITSPAGSSLSFSAAGLHNRKDI